VLACKYSFFKQSQTEVEKQMPMWKYAVVGGVALVTVAGLLGLSFYLGGTLVKDAHEVRV